MLLQVRLCNTPLLKGICSSTPHILIALLCWLQMVAHCLCSTANVQPGQEQGKL
jgi:hypothetical protein